jgi:hypothetical protein
MGAGSFRHGTTYDVIEVAEMTAKIVQDFQVNGHDAPGRGTDRLGYSAPWRQRTCEGNLACLEYQASVFRSLDLLPPRVGNARFLFRLVPDPCKGTGFCLHDWRLLQDGPMARCSDKICQLTPLPPPCVGTCYKSMAIQIGRLKESVKIV